MLLDRTTITTLYANPNAAVTAAIQMVFAEKEVQPALKTDLPPALASTCPLPTLIDDNLVVYTPALIFEYLDDRFPEPQLLPIAPTEKTTVRMIIHKLLSEWYPLVDEKQFHTINTKLIEVLSLFTTSPFLASKELTLMDCVMTPILSAFKANGYQYPHPAITAYAARIAERKTYPATLKPPHYEDYRDATDLGWAH